MTNEANLLKCEHFYHFSVRILINEDYDEGYKNCVKQLRAYRWWVWMSLVQKLLKNVERNSENTRMCQYLAIVYPGAGTLMHSPSIDNKHKINYRLTQVPTTKFCLRLGTISSFLTSRGWLNRSMPFLSRVLDSRQAILILVLRVLSNEACVSVSGLVWQVYLIRHSRISAARDHSRPGHSSAH